MNCPQCGAPAVLVDGRVLRPDVRKFHHRNFWTCPKCDVHVGCHKGTTEPLGTLADRETRQARLEAHEAFDRLWKFKVWNLDRPQWYAWLADKLGLTADECHIGRMDREMCREVVKVSIAELRRHDAIRWPQTPKT